MKDTLLLKSRTLTDPFTGRRKRIWEVLHAEWGCRRTWTASYSSAADAITPAQRLAMEL